VTAQCGQAGTTGWGAATLGDDAGRADASISKQKRENAFHGKMLLWVYKIF